MRSVRISLIMCVVFAAAAFYFAPLADKAAFSEDGKSKILFEAIDETRERRELTELGGTKPIYGKDDRMDWGKISDRRVQATATASVALFTYVWFAEEESGTLRLRTQTLEDRLNLCPGQRFLKQWSGSFCSGVLVGEDVVATAGHCIAEVKYTSSAVPLRDIRFVFGYTASDQRDPGRSVFDRKQIFAARELIGGKNLAEGEDWALIRLDRPVPKEIAEPVKKIRKSKIEDGAPVFAVGYPNGLPLKFASGAEVRKNDSEKFFMANVDTFEGNSGSGIFSTATNELVGILTAGATDYHRSKTALCNEAYLCPRNGCSGETVTRIEIVKIP
jgi:V8-like Glu-specific endopeptidase